MIRIDESGTLELGARVRYVGRIARAQVRYAGIAGTISHVGSVAVHVVWDGIENDGIAAYNVSDLEPIKPTPPTTDQ